MSAAPATAWDLARLAAVPTEHIAAALASDRDVPLPAAIMHAVAEELDVLVTAAADGAVANANVIERLVARSRIAAELAGRAPERKGTEP